MVPVPIIDLNEKAYLYTYLQVERPYIALNSETYSSLRNQELRTCKNIGNGFYSEERFVVKHKSKYICESTIYFNLGSMKSLRKVVTLLIILITPTSSLQYLMVGMKVFWYIGLTINILNVIKIMIYPEYPASPRFYWTEVYSETEIKLENHWLHVKIQNQNWLCTSWWIQLLSITLTIWLIL